MALSMILQLERGDRLDVREFAAADGLSELYRVELVATWAGGAPADLGALIGSSATFAYEVPGAARRAFEGVVSEIRQVEGSLYRIVLLPPVARLEQRVRARIFERAADLDIVRQLLDEASITATFEVSRTSAQCAYRTQYRQSDHAFLRRLLDASGLVYLHRQEGGAARLVVTDAPTLAGRRPAAALRTTAGSVRVTLVAEWEARDRGVAARTCTFEAGAADVSPGQVVTIADAPSEPLLVVRVEWSGSASGGVASRVTAVSSSAPLGAFARTAPTSAGVETATVIARPADAGSADTGQAEEPGRVRVRFDWDRPGDASPDSSSCWLQALADRTDASSVGDTVIVGFVGANPDEPIILGRLPGARRSLAPTTAKRLEFGAGEVMFEDKAGKEVVTIQAERDMRTVVKNNEDKTVGNHRSTKIRGNDTEHVSGNQKASVLGQVMESVGGDKLGSVLGNSVSQVGNERILKTLGELASSAKVHRLTSQDGTTLSVGDSMIHLTPDAIILQAPRILLNPGQDVGQHAVLTGRTPTSRTPTSSSGGGEPGG